MRFPLVLKKVYRKLSLALARRELILEGMCRQCGSCCRGLVLRRNGRGLVSEGAFRELVREAPEYGRFRIEDRDDDGLLVFSCSRLAEDGSCTDYANRPEVCRSYPHKTIYWRGDNTPAHCGFRFVVRRRFGPALARELKRLEKK